MGFDNLHDAWRITDINSNFEYVAVYFYVFFDTPKYNFQSVILQKNFECQLFIGLT